MPNLIELISAEELEIFRDYACYSQELNSVASKEVLFRHWDANKQDLYRLLGDNFILSKSVNFIRPAEELCDDMNRAIRDNAVWSKLHIVLDRIYKDERDLYWSIAYNFSYTDLVSNKWRLDNVTLPASILPNSNKPLKFQNGMRLTKAIEKLLKAYGVYDEAEYEEFRIAHSMVLNNAKMQGTLHLSIHPLDYATMSDNNFDWNSCMSWLDEGEYRQGTVEMMNSPYVVVAYVTSESRPTFELCYEEKWNNKKWRKLYIVTPELITGIKPYPYEMPTIEQECLSWLRELAVTNWGMKYFDETVRIIPNSLTTLPNGNKCTFTFTTGFMYNDTGSSNLYAYVAPDISSYHNVMYSGRSMCLVCGDEINIDLPDAMTCSACGNWMQCACCGEFRRADDMIRQNGYYYCEACYDEGFECPVCGEFYTGDATFINVRIGNNHIAYLEVCDDCYKEFEEYVTYDGTLEMTQFESVDDVPAFIPSWVAGELYDFYEKKKNNS